MIRRALLSLLLLTAAPAPAFAQAQAANGNIEGTVRDSSGGVLPLPLGPYAVGCEHRAFQLGFKVYF